MKRTQKNKSFLRLFRLLYLKIFRINDSPQRIAVGFGLGVFLGIVPGTGPVASLVLATLFGVNRASALLGSLLTNTWLSLATFILSLKIGSLISGLNPQEVKATWDKFTASFHWPSLLKASTLTMILPIFTGYLIVGLSAGLAAYLVIMIILKIKKTKLNAYQKTPAS